MKTEKLNTHALLLKKYPPGEYALMAEVSDAAGFGRSRSADFVAMSLWPSRGLSITGFERKSYRGDWLKELKTPEKAENIFQYCDYWYLLTDSEDVARIDEIPETWGWMHVLNGKIRVMKYAPKLNPVPLTKHFIATMLKRSYQDAADYIHRSEIENKITEARAEGVELGKKTAGYERDRLIRNFEELKTTVTNFEDAAGIKIESGWRFDAKKTGAVVRFLLDGGVDKTIEDIKEARDRQEKYLKTLDNLIESTLS